MRKRKTIDERMDQWLNDQADRNYVPDEDRQQFIDFMRETTSAAVTRLSFALGDLYEDLGRAFGLHWVRRMLRGIGRR